MPHRRLLWHIFCTVIDNYGDIGVCWRLAVQLAQRGQRVRLWVDDVRPLQWLAPQGHTGVQVQTWRKPLSAADLPNEAADVLIEAFGCTLDDAVQAQWAQQQRMGARRLWLNLEYLCAQDFAARNHLLASPVMHGPAKGCVKRFFYPVFTADTGGLLRETDLLPHQAAFDRAAWLQTHGATAQRTTLSLFCYEPPALPALLTQLAQADEATHLLVTPGRAQDAVAAALPAPLAPSWATTGQVQHGACTLRCLPWLPQTDFDHLLWASQCNFVRGEDSLTRALWAGQPFIWHIYPQDDAAHHAKLEAFLDWLNAPPDLRAFHRIWNGIDTAPLPPLRWRAWQTCFTAARQRLLQQDDLLTQLLALAHAPR